MDLRFSSRQEHQPKDKCSQPQILNVNWRVQAKALMTLCVAPLKNPTLPITGISTPRMDSAASLLIPNTVSISSRSSVGFSASSILSSAAAVIPAFMHGRQTIGSSVSSKRLFPHSFSAAVM